MHNFKMPDKGGATKVYFLAFSNKHLTQISEFRAVVRRTSAITRNFSGSKIELVQTPVDLLRVFYNRRLVFGCAVKWPIRASYSSLRKKKLGKCLSFHLSVP